MIFFFSVTLEDNRHLGPAHNVPYVGTEIQNTIPTNTLYHYHRHPCRQVGDVQTHKSDLITNSADSLSKDLMSLQSCQLLI